MCVRQQLLFSYSLVGLRNAGSRTESPHNITELLVFPQVQDRHAVIELLNEFAVKYEELKFDEKVHAGIDWLQDRQSDAATPVSGDVRAAMEAAAYAFKLQSDKNYAIERGVGTLLYWLQMFEYDERPEATKAFRLFGMGFYVSYGDEVIVQKFREVNVYLEEFYNMWQRRL
jgi:hypothetical protein